jgi:hypothetical protein
MSRPKVSEVFTPRSATVNPAMYIERPRNERDLKRAIGGSLHPILSGESGSGKSWLYRHVARIEGWRTYYANAGNAARYKSLTNVIELAVREQDEREVTEFTQELGAEAKIVGLGGSGKAGRKYEVKKRETLLEAFKSAREKAGSGVTLLVIDNFEAIFPKPELMEELGNIILLVDDPDYAKYEVKILIVGVPSDVVEYYQRLPNLEPVTNRLTELPPLFSLKLGGQIEDFVKRGFVGHLKIPLTTAQSREIALHLDDVTLGIPQRLHEYCEFLGHFIEDSGWAYDSSLLNDADGRFLQSSLRKAYTVVNGCMNERKTKTGRRNQVLYALGKLKATEFDVKGVERMVRTEFPQSTSNTALAVGQMMTELSEGDAPLLRRAPKGYTYRFADPRYLMCIRAMLRKNPSDEKVIKRTLSR